jgi:hypothetical protein
MRPDPGMPRKASLYLIVVVIVATALLIASHRGYLPMLTFQWRR